MKAKSKFNIIDIILIAAVLAAAAFAAFMVISGRVGAKKSELRSIEYTVLLTNVKKSFIDNIKVDDYVTDTVKLMPIGQVKEVDNDNQSEVQIEDYDIGRIVTAEVPDTYDVIVTISATANVENGFYMIGGYQINVGTLVSLRVPNFTGSGFCTSVTEVKDNG